MVKRLRSTALAMVCIGLAAPPAGAAEEPACQTVACAKLCESAIERWSLEVARRYGIEYALWHKAEDKRLNCLNWSGARYCRAFALPCR